VAPEVESLIVTVWLLVYVPAAGENVGVATVEAWHIADAEKTTRRAPNFFANELTNSMRRISLSSRPPTQVFAVQANP
jgi:hypothetical protein